MRQKKQIFLVDLRESMIQTMLLCWGGCGAGSGTENEIRNVTANIRLLFNK